MGKSQASSGNDAWNIYFIKFARTGTEIPDWPIIPSNICINSK